MKDKLKKYIPNQFNESIFEIDFLSLYKEGYRLLFIDIDNTLVSYTEETPTEEVLKLVEDLRKIGFEIILISNNYYKRVSIFAAPFGDIPFIHYALKPFKRGFKKGLKMFNNKYKKDEVIAIGDQLMTDVKGANKMGFYSILIRAIEKKTDVLSTRINRFFERRVLKKVKKKHYEQYEKTLKQYENM